MSASLGLSCFRERCSENAAGNKCHYYDICLLWPPVSLFIFCHYWLCAKNAVFYNSLALDVILPDSSSAFPSGPELKRVPFSESRSGSPFERRNMFEATIHSPQAVSTPTAARDSQRADGKHVDDGTDCG